MEIPVAGIDTGPREAEPVSSSFPLCSFALLSFAAFLMLSVGFALTRAPWWDEGLFADVAINFSRFGHLGSTALDPYGYLELPGVHQYTFWQFPLYLISLGIYFKAIVPSVEAMRVFSTFWGMLYLLSWYLLVQALTKRRRWALFLTAVVSLDYSLIAAASDGRMEMMCAALGLSGLASYAQLRDFSWTGAIVISGWLGAASLFCHPMGLVTNGVLAAVVLMDYKRIKRTGLVLASIPYLIGLALCATYALSAFDIFRAQSKAASAYRVSGLTPILQSIFNDVYLRYVRFYLLSLDGVNKLKVGSLVFAVLGLIGMVSKRHLRNSRLGQILLISVSVGYIGVAAIDNQKFPIYFVYVMPAMTACGAVWVLDEWSRRGKWRFAAAGFFAAFILATVGGFGEKIHRDDYRTLYNPAVAAIRSVGYPTRGLMGGSELGFALGFNENLIDDRYLGQISGKKADIYVVNAYYGGMGGPKLGPAWEASQKDVKANFDQVFENSAYKVFSRRAR
jgi:hypothetical protein